MVIGDPSLGARMLFTDSIRNLASACASTESGLDPETNSWANQNTAVAVDGYTGKHKMPIVGYNTPATRNFIFGLNVTF